MKKAKKLLSEVFALAMMFSNITVNVHAEEPTTTEEEPNVIVEETIEENQPAEVESSESLTEAIAEDSGADNTLSEYFESSESVNAIESSISDLPTYYINKEPIIVPVGQSVTKADVPLHFTDPSNSESAIDISPDDIDHFAPQSTIFELSEDGQEVYVIGSSNYPMGNFIEAYLKGENVVCVFCVRGVVAAQYTYVDPHTYVPLITGVSNSAGAVTDAVSSVTDDTTPATDYNNGGSAYVELDYYPLDATYDVSIIEDGMTYGWKEGLPHTVTAPDVEYIELFDSTDSPAYGTLKVSAVHDVTLQYTFFDENGTSQSITSEVHIVENLPYADFGVKYTNNIFAVYETATGSMYCMETDENGNGAIQLNVGEAVRVGAMTCRAVNGQNNVFAYPKYAMIGGLCPYRLEFPENQQRTDIVAIDRQGNLTGANQGKADITLTFGGDPSVDVSFTVEVSPSENPGTDSVESYSIKHLKNNYWDPYEVPEPEYLGEPAQNPKVYNCLSGGGDILPHLYQLEMKRSTTGKSFTVNDAAIIAQMETLVPSFRPENGPSYDFCFEIKSYNTKVSSTESGLSSETTVLFEAVLPGSVRLKLDDTHPLTLNSVFVGTAEAGVADYSNEMDPDVVATLQEQIKSPAGSSYGLTSYDLISRIPADMLDQSDQSYSKIETSLKCTVKGFDSEFSNVKLDLTPQYTLYDENNVACETKPLDIKDTTVEVSINVGNLYEPGPVKIKHTKNDGTEYYYEGTVSDDGILTFKNPNGFSDFEITETPAFAKHNLVLSGEIGVNFFMELPKVEGVDYNESYVDFKVSGKTVRVDYDKSKPKQSDDKTYRVFTCYVNVLQMAEPITAEFHYGNETILDSYSVKKYIEGFVNLTGYLEADVDLVKAIADYGYHSQRLLAETHGFTLGKNRDYASMGNVYYNYYNKLGDKYYYYREALAGTTDYAIKKGTNDNIEKVSFSLDLSSSTSIFVYFTPADGYNGRFDVTVDGKTVVPEHRNDGQYRVKITGIPAHKLGESHTIIVTTDVGQATTEVSALSYVNAVLSTESFSDSKKEKIIKCATSLYYYYIKTMAYRAAHQETYN